MEGTEMSWLRGRTMMLLVVVLLLLSAGGTGLAEPGGWDHWLIFIGSMFAVVSRKAEKNGEWRISEY